MFNLTIIVAHRNRSLNFLPDGQVLTLFPNLVQSLNKAMADLKVSAPHISIGMIVADAGHPDEAAPLGHWLARQAKFGVRIEDDVSQRFKPFNKGKLLNRALATMGAVPVFICDTDMLLTADLLLDICRNLEGGSAFAPICWSYKDPEHKEGWWRDTGSGMLAFNWDPENPIKYVEKTEWGSEDWLFFRELESRGVGIVRTRAQIFHQWHPTRMGWGADN